MKSDFANWSDVRVFLAVLRLGSTLAAAKELGMSQPTVARRIEALEHTLGLHLFEKDTRGFHATAASRMITPDALDIENAAMALQRKAFENLRDTQKVIKLTAPSSSFSGNFARIISDFTRLHSSVKFEFVASPKIVDLIAGDADVALRFARSIDDPRLICTRLTTVRMAAYASQVYVEKHGCPTSEAEFAGHSFIGYTNRPGSREANEWLMRYITPSQVVSYCPDIESALTAAKAGFGIAGLSVSIARHEADLVKCMDLPEELFFNSWLVISPQAYRRPEVKAFSAFFAPRFRALFADLK